ncbi:hypothetical protein Q7P37_003227 [Cladosporium fusiforme]
MSIEERLPEAAAPRASPSATPDVEHAEAAQPSTTPRDARAGTPSPRNNSSSSSSESAASHTTLMPRESTSVANESPSNGSIPLIWTRGSIQLQPLSGNGSIRPAGPPNSMRSNATLSTTGTLISAPNAAMPPYLREHANAVGEAVNSHPLVSENQELATATFHIPRIRHRMIYPLSGREEGAAARRQMEDRVMQWNEASEGVA